MSRAAITYPSKDQLRKMTMREINSYILDLQSALQWRVGPAKRAVEKYLAVAEKVREIRRGRDAAGE
jgi:hypothetical protein